MARIFQPYRNLRKGCVAMTMEDNLVERFGPLIPLAGLATLLDRSPEAVRMFLRSNSDLAQRINTAKLKVGRRLYFRTLEVAKFLSGESK
jgi:hypothetical protein